MSIERYIERLAAMSTEERHRHIEAAPLPTNVGTLLDSAAADAGEQDALNFFQGEGSISYRALKKRVNQTANALRQWGIEKGTHVAVMLPNIPLLPTTWLALARLGAVMVPVNTRYTARELQYIIEDANVTFLIIHADFESLLDPHNDGTTAAPYVDPRHIALFGANEATRYRTIEELLRGQSHVLKLPYDVTSSDLLNIQYTSGTTGFPKGCMLTHQYWLVCGKVNALRDAKRFRHILAATPFFYMDPQWLLLMTFFQRGTLFVAQRQSASQFSEWLRAYRINFCLFPELAYKQPAHKNDHDTVLARANIYGISKGNHAGLRRRFKAPAMEAFGMTETGSCLYVPLEREDLVGSGSCGIPAPFRRCRIVDNDGKEVAAGDMGELVVCGDGIMLGYYRKPEANHESYFGKWFRTGDLFRQDAQGFYYIVGRLKDMVRRSGENIAAREVEAILRGVAGVVDAAVVPVPDEVRGEEVKAYIVLQQSENCSISEIAKIFSYCEKNLASFKVPRYLEFIDELPRTPSGKIAKHKLTAHKLGRQHGTYDRTNFEWHEMNGDCK